MATVTVTLTPGETKSINTAASITVGTNVFVRNLSDYRIQVKEAASAPSDMTANANVLSPCDCDGQEREYVTGSLEIWAMCPTASPKPILVAVETA
jgi:hypothetical protein